MFLQTLTMSGAIASLAAHGSAHDHGHFDLLIVHVSKLARLVDQLVGGQSNEVAKHNLDDRPHPGHSDAVSQSNNPCFANGGIEHAPGKSGAQSSGHFE